MKIIEPEGLTYFLVITIVITTLDLVTTEERKILSEGQSTSKIVYEIFDFFFDFVIDFFVIFLYFVVIF